MIELVDTHCHIHEATFQLEGDSETRARWLRANQPDPDDMLNVAAEHGVKQIICVGTTVEDSRLATEFAAERPSGVWASIGIHPHETSLYVHNHKALQQFRNLAERPKVVAVGEIGLDYYYTHSSRANQEQLLRFQLDLAVEYKLPVIFHVRDAFDDFWPIFDEYPGIRGVIHSFSAGPKELGQILERNLYVGLNGITTFTKKPEQLEAAKAVPLDRLLLETDAPFLTPEPERGKICTPRHVRVTAEFLSGLRGETLEELAAATTRNAKALFNI